MWLVGASTSAGTVMHAGPIFSNPFGWLFSLDSAVSFQVCWSVLREHPLQTSWLSPSVQHFVLQYAFLQTRAVFISLDPQLHLYTGCQPGSACVPPLCSVAWKFPQGNISGTIRWINWFASYLSKITVCHCLMSSILKTIVLCILSFVVVVISSWRLKGKSGPLLLEVEAIPLLFSIFWYFSLRYNWHATLVSSVEHNDLIFVCIAPF